MKLNNVNHNVNQQNQELLKTLKDKPVKKILFVCLGKQLYRVRIFRILYKKTILGNWEFYKMKNVLLGKVS